MDETQGLDDGRESPRVGPGKGPRGFVSAVQRGVGEGTRVVFGLDFSEDFCDRKTRGE